jgi:hypothetical protein
VWSDKKKRETYFSGAYDLAPDGKHIVALMPMETPEAQQAQSHVSSSKTSSTNCGEKCRWANNCNRA